MPGPQQIEVAAGVLTNDAGHVLVAKRNDASHAGGSWEFPGGKLKQCESPETALSRELREEIGIEVRSSVHLITYSHEYPERIVRLHVFEVRDWTGEPVGLEGQPLRWLPTSSLMDEGLLAADLPIVERLLACRPSRRSSDPAR